MSQIDRVDGGVHTARVSAALADRIHREQQQDDARQYLLRRGLDDVAEILGLVRPASVPATPPAEVSKPKPARKPTSSSGKGRQRKGCPSEAQQRRHRERGEKCAACTELVRRVNAERKHRARQRRAAA
ncbi:hypothetical protein ACFYUR_21875 [Micromonospora haikouensis]|uniref:hypothetical protein n=1 Tax=Micromonospora haikouensis TaxID=686309 RepID=UPI0036861D39